MDLRKRTSVVTAAFAALIASGRAPRAQVPTLRATSLPAGTRVDAWRWRNRSKYTPHQGEREAARRRLGGFHRVVHHDAWCPAGDNEYAQCHCGVTR